MHLLTLGLLRGVSDPRWMTYKQAQDKGWQVRQGEKIGRNDPCPCGSGKKYKHCHGKLS